MSSQEYAEMIEVPINSCEMLTYNRPKKSLLSKLLPNFKKRKTTAKTEQENFDGQEITTTNLEEDTFEKSDEDLEISEDLSEDVLVAEDILKKDKSGQKPKFKFNIIACQVATICVLALTILLTTVFWQDSGINNLFKSVFKLQSKEYDNRMYTEFTPSLNKDSIVDGANGIIKLKAGAIYTPVNGEILEIKYNNQKYTVTIEHSDNFKSVVAGLDYCYFGVGDKVFTSTPIGYVNESEAEISMYNDDSIITNFSLQDGNVIWQSVGQT